MQATMNCTAPQNYNNHTCYWWTENDGFSLCCMQHNNIKEMRHLLKQLLYMYESLLEI